MTSKKKQQNKRGHSSEKGNGHLPTVSGRIWNMSSEIYSSNDIQPSNGYSVKYCSLNTVTNGEGLSLVGVIFV